MRRLPVVAACALLGLWAVLAANASAAVEFGDECLATAGEPGYTAVPLARTSAGGLPLDSPSDGILTSWTVRISPGFPIEAVPVRLLVFRPTADPGTFELIGTSADSGAGQPAFTTRTRVPVHSGDRLGLYGGEGSGTPICSSAEPGDRVGFLAGTARMGLPQAFAARSGFRLPVTATVEADRDGDGYGDETQDGCPQSPAYQLGCPRLTIELSGATVRKRSIRLRVRASSEASVRVLGQVAWGFRPKGMPLPGHEPPSRLIVGLRGGQKTVDAGKSAWFEVALPKPVLRRLDRIAPPRELKARFTASATQLDGVVEKAHLTVHLRGRGAGS